MWPPTCDMMVMFNPDLRLPYNWTDDPELIEAKAAREAATPSRWVWWGNDPRFDPYRVYSYYPSFPEPVAGDPPSWGAGVDWPNAGSLFKVNYQSVIGSFIEVLNELKPAAILTVTRSSKTVTVNGQETQWYVRFDQKHRNLLSTAFPEGGDLNQVQAALAQYKSAISDYDFYWCLTTRRVESPMGPWSVYANEELLRTPAPGGDRRWIDTPPDSWLSFGEDLPSGGEIVLNANSSLPNALLKQIDGSAEPFHIRSSNLPFDTLIAAVNAIDLSSLGLPEPPQAGGNSNNLAFIQPAGEYPGGFVSEYVGYWAHQYRHLTENATYLPRYYYTGHLHIGSSTPPLVGEQALLVVLDQLVAILNAQ